MTAAEWPPEPIAIPTEQIRMLPDMDQPARLYTRDTIDWSFDDVQRQYRLGCSECGAKAMRAGASWAQEWCDEHVCEVTK